jgi:hypothetical protein
MSGCKSRFWKPILSPQNARKWEVDIIKKLKDNKHYPLNGLICCTVSITKFVTIADHGFAPGTIGKYTFPETIKRSELALVCHVVFCSADDGEFEKDICTIKNPHSIVVIGQFKPYNTPGETRGWTPTKSVKDALAYNKSIPPIYAFHGTNCESAKTIIRSGFRTLDNMKEDNKRGVKKAHTIEGNYFTPYPWYAANFAEPNNLLVCQIKLKHPMTEKEFESKRHPLAHSSITKTLEFLNYVEEKGYDGGIWRSEIWTWNPKAVIVVGELVPFS